MTSQATSLIIIICRMIYSRDNHSPQKGILLTKTVCIYGNKSLQELVESSQSFILQYSICGRLDYGHHLIAFMRCTNQFKLQSQNILTTKILSADSHKGRDARNISTSAAKIDHMGNKIKVLVICHGLRKWQINTLYSLLY